MLTRSGAGPHVREQLPGVFAVGSRIQRRRLPWSLVDADLDGFDRSAIVQHDSEHFVAAAVSRDARDERLQLHMRDCGLVPPHFAIDHLASNRAVPTRLIFAEILFLLGMDLR